MYYVLRKTMIKIQPTLTKGYKVTLYSDYLREISLYTIYRNSPNLGCPKGHCEYGHYTLVFDMEGFAERLARNQLATGYRVARIATGEAPIVPGKIGQ